VFFDLECGPQGTTVCGTYGTFFSGDNLRDTDWYRVVVPQPAVVTVSVIGEAPTLVGILDGNAGCQDFSVACAKSSSAPCESTGCQIGVTAGTYWIFVAPSVFSGVACGSSYVLSASCTPTSTVALGNLHCNHADGQAYLSPFGTSVLGTVTGNWPNFSDSRFTIQDATGGLTVLGSPLYCGELSEQVLITGLFGQDRGMVVMHPISIQTIHAGSPQPDPRVLTPAEVNASFQPNYCEPNESRLVQVRGVFIRKASGDSLVAGAFFETDGRYRLVSPVDGSYTMLHVLQDGTSCGTMNPLVGTTIPTSCPVDVTGVLGQDDTILPYTEGYEIRPRFPLDIAVACSVRAEALTWGRLKARYR
jgi:hypothetical protein